MNIVKFFFISIVLLCLACGERKNPNGSRNQPLSQKQKDSLLAKYKLKYAEPIFQTNSPSIIIPLSTRSYTSRKLYSSSSGSSGSYPRYWNILFYNRSTGTSKLLTEEKYRINSLQANIKKAGVRLQKSILYQSRIFDYNEDGKLNYLDPQVLLISDTNGDKLKRISPKEENLVSYSIVPEKDQIIIKTVRDNNENKVFESSDSTILYRIDIAKNNQIVEIVNAQLRAKIDNLHLEKWLPQE
ncbi:MAG: hypothetical protein AAF518_11130 [Spirochaetota bacterium]